MTLIIGLNLVDRVILAADTRATERDGFKHDNVIKISPISGGAVLDKSKYDKDDIAVAVAGHVSLAAFVFRKIRHGIKKGVLSCDIRKLFDQLNEEYIRDLADLWLQEGNKYSKECCLIFTGICKDRKKEVSRDKLKELIDIYEKSFENKTPENFPHEFLGEGGILRIPEQFVEIAVNQSNKLESCFDSLVFCLEIGINKSKLHFKKSKVEWGEFLARGSKGISEGSLPKEILATLELMYRRNVHHESEFISQTILRIAKQNSIDTIGGTVLINVINKEGPTLIWHKNYYEIRDGVAYLKGEEGRWSKAIGLRSYYNKDSSAEL